MFLVSPFLLCGLLAGCATDRRAPHPDLVHVWREYTSLPEQRAIAIAGDPERDRWVTGASGGQESLEEAEEEALAECRRRRAKRRMQDSCRLYAIGDEVVWTGPD